MKSTTRNTPYGYTIFCDDVRQETGNKISHMGVYRGQLILNTPPPASLPKFLLVIYYFERPGESTEPVYLHVYLPGDAEDEPMFNQELPLDNARLKPPEPETPDSDPLIAVISQIMIAPLELKSEGRIRVRAYRGDLEVRLGTLAVVFGQTVDSIPIETPPTTKKPIPKKPAVRKRARPKKGA